VWGVRGIGPCFTFPARKFGLVGAVKGWQSRYPSHLGPERPFANAAGKPLHHSRGMKS